MSFRCRQDQKSLLHQLELREYVTVPLTGRAGPIGALSLAMAESGRVITPRDVELAQELGARAGIALENAQLFQAADERREELDAVLAALAESVLVFDGAGKLRMGNQAARRTFQGALPTTLGELLMSPAPTSRSRTTSRWRSRSTDVGDGTTTRLQGFAGHGGIKRRPADDRGHARHHRRARRACSARRVHGRPVARAANADHDDLWRQRASCARP